MRDFQCKSLVEQAERHPKAEASEEAGSLLTTSCSSLVVAVMQPFRSKPLRCHEIAPARDRLDRGRWGLSSGPWPAVRHHGGGRASDRPVRLSRAVQEAHHQASGSRLPARSSRPLVASTRTRDTILCSQSHPHHP
jgi:hypothetical protein